MVVLESGVVMTKYKGQRIAQIKKECDEVATMLSTKNENYGDSAVNPIQIFSKLSASEAILASILFGPIPQLIVRFVASHTLFLIV